MYFFCCLLGLKKNEFYTKHTSTSFSSTLTLFLPLWLLQLSLCCSNTSTSFLFQMLHPSLFFLLLVLRSLFWPSCQSRYFLRLFNNLYENLYLIIFLNLHVASFFFERRNFHFYLKEVIESNQDQQAFTVTAGSSRQSASFALVILFYLFHNTWSLASKGPWKEYPPFHQFLNWPIPLLKDIAY